MTPAQLLDSLRGSGFLVEVRGGRRLVVSPASKLTDEQSAAIRANRDDLLWLLDSDAVETANRAERIWSSALAKSTPAQVTLGDEYESLKTWFLEAMESGRLPSGPTVLTRDALGRPVVQIMQPATTWAYYAAACLDGRQPAEVRWFLKLLKEAIDP